MARLAVLAALLVLGTPRALVVPGAARDARGAALRAVKGVKNKRAKRVDGAVPTEPLLVPRSRMLRGDIRSRTGGGKAPQRRNTLQGGARDAGMNNPSRLKVLGGAARGRRLDSPDVFLRPMMAKVRESLYATLESFGVFARAQSATRRVVDGRAVGGEAAALAGGARVLDLFAGSGCVGIEALSRGAREAVFVDFAQECADCAERNAAWCGFDVPLRARSVCARVEDVLLAPAEHGLEPRPFDLVTVTPPYEQVVYSDLVAALCASPLVGEDTIVVIEYPVELGALPPTLGDPPRLVGVRNRKYGRTVLGIYACRPTGRYNLEPRPEEFTVINW